MARIILEDIKINKKRKVILKKEETLISALPNIEKDLFVDKLKGYKLDEHFNNKEPRRQRIQRTPHLRTKSNGFNKSILIFLVLSFVIGIIYWGGIYFQKADIIVTSKHQPITYNNKQFTVLKESNGETDDIMIMIYPDKKIKKMILTEPKDVSIKAQGSITLYNEFSATPQKLSAGTFIADNDGKTYKIESNIIIPGYKMDNKKVVSGQIVANLSAFLPGDTYNGAPTDFHITSYKGTSRYNKIYGKLKSPFIGGAVGTVYSLNEQDIKNIDSMAQTSFKDEILKKVQSSIYPGYILYPNAMTFSYKIGDSSISKTPEAEVSIEGILSVVLIKEKSLKNNVMKVSLPEITGSELKEINIFDLSKLTFNFTNKDQVITKDMSSVSFYLSGDLDVVWNPDTELLKTRLLGMDKINALSVFRQDPGISSAMVKVFPQWQKFIPDDLSKINVIVK